MTDLVFVFLAALAIYRLSRMIALEEGPFRWFAWIQERTEKQDTWIKRGLHCPACLSWWFAFFAAFYFLPLSLPQFLLTWWGLAGAAMALYQRYH